MNTKGIYDIIDSTAKHEFESFEFGTMPSALLSSDIDNWDMYFAMHGEYDLESNVFNTQHVYDGLSSHKKTTKIFEYLTIKEKQDLAFFEKNTRLFCKGIFLKIAIDSTTFSVYTYNRTSGKLTKHIVDATAAKADYVAHPYLVESWYISPYAEYIKETPIESADQIGVFFNKVHEADLKNLFQVFL